MTGESGSEDESTSLSSSPPVLSFLFLVQILKLRIRSRLPSSPREQRKEKENSRTCYCRGRGKFFKAAPSFLFFREGGEDAAAVAPLLPFHVTRKPPPPDKGDETESSPLCSHVLFLDFCAFFDLPATKG